MTGSHQDVKHITKKVRIPSKKKSRYFSMIVCCANITIRRSCCYVRLAGIRTNKRMAKGRLRELFKKKYFISCHNYLFQCPLIRWFFIGYWILNGAEFLFWPFFLPTSVCPCGKERRGQVRGNAGSRTLRHCLRENGKDPFFHAYLLPQKQGLIV